VPQAPAGGGGGPKRERIVWADDNADMREYVRRLLSARYDVETVADGEAALAAVRERRPDVVLADVMMPKLDGLALARALRADPETRTIPLILLSARAGDEARIEGLDAGADDYLYKPFGARELLAHVGARMEQVRAREIIRRSEERYRKIFQTAGVSIWEEDFSDVKRALDELTESGVSDLPRYIHEHPDFVQRAIGLVKIRDVNQATLRLFGARTKTELMQSLHDVFVAETATVFRDELIAIAEGRATFEAEETVRTLQGERREVLINVAFPSADTGFERVLVTLIDISDRKAAEQAARQDAEIMETLNRVGLTLSAEWDLERVIQTVTDAATKISGAEFGAFFHNVTNEDGESYMLYTLSGAPREAFEKFGMPRNTAVFAPTFAGERAVRVDDITRDPRYGKSAPHYGMPKGHLPVRSYLAVPVVSRSGDVMGGLFFGHSAVGVFTERAEQLVSGIASQAAVAIDNARLHEQRAQLIERLSESDRRKDEFLATLSHELRNPLAPLRNSLHLLRLSRTAAASGQVHEMMERQVDHLVRLVDDLLEVSRISRGTFELRKQRVDVAAVIRNAIDTSDPLILAGGHQLRTSIPETPLWLEGDPVRLAQILSNVLNNAAKYTEPGGRIALVVERRDDMAVIRISDTGIGIARDALPRMFEMFSRGSSTTARGQGGLGIGLALARRLAEMHGGTITASSEGVGKGSQFEVRLPLAADQGAPQPAPRTEAPIGAPRILVVDDNRDSGDSLSMILQAIGAEVRVARDGPEALAVFASYDPAVVLLDIGMPGMDGYEVARRIRGGFPERHPTLVALTGWGQESDRQKAESAGFDHHLIKPADIGVLRSLLAAIGRP
jgi:PAS domain S-box-containing protein